MFRTLIRNVMGVLAFLLVWAIFPNQLRNRGLTPFTFTLTAQNYIDKIRGAGVNK